MSETLLTKLYEQLPDPVWILQGHRFVAANAAALAAIGYPEKSALLSLHPSELSPERQPDGELSYAKSERMMAIAEQRGLHRFDWTHQRRDGSLLPAEVTLLAMDWEGRPALYCLWRDLTERERHRELLENMEEVAGIGGWELDLATQMIRWTKQVYRIHELPPGVPIPLDRGVSFYGLEARQVLEKALRLAAEQGRPWDLELPFVTARGRSLRVRTVGRAVWEGGRIVRLHGCFQDVTERHAAEQARAGSQRRLQFVTDHAPVMIAWVDRDYRYRFVNRHYAGMFGLQPGELVGRSVRDALGEPAFALARRYMAEALEGQELGYELDMPDLSGGIRHLREAYAPEWDDSGQVIGFVAAITDISERKRAEQLAIARAQVLELIANDAPLRQILEAIANNVEKGSPPVLCSIHLLDAEGRRLYTGAAPNLPEAFTQTLEGVEVGYAGSACVAAAFTGRRVIVEDIATHPDWTAYRDLAAMAQLGACWSEPILSATGRALGAFALYHPIAREPRTAEIGLLEESARLAAIAMERDQVLGQLRYSEARYRLLTETVTDVIWTLDGDGRWTYISPAVRTLLGYTVEEAVQLPVAALLTPDGAAELTDIRRNMAAVGGGEEPRPIHRGELELTRKDGSKVWVEITMTRLRDDTGQAEGVLGVLRDISDRKQNEFRVWRQATHDELTGLPNRRLFQDRLQQGLARAGRAGQRLALLFIDLDRFKEVNDSVGHAAGDQFLVEVAQRVQGCLRRVDTVARMGGDEFTVIMADMATTRRVDTVARKIIDALARPFVLQDKSFVLTASIGIALYPDHGEAVDELMQHADQAMYDAKRRRNQYRYFTPALHAEAMAQQQLSQDLRDALAQGQFEVHYQPIVELASGRIGMAEAQVCWRHPRRGLLTADAFIPEAETSGLIIELGDWAFREAVRWVLARRRRLGVPFRVSMNKSQLQCVTSPVEQSWPAWLGEMGLAGDAIVIEVTEALLLSDRPEILDKLRQLRSSGMQMAIDDFGAGYSALSYLKHFKVDFLKIDTSFVRELGDNRETQAFCEAIIAMAHKLAMQVIAQGVETAAQRDCLRAAGCDCAQGSLFAHPRPAAEIDW